jgi:hypothetical protein
VIPPVATLKFAPAAVMVAPIKTATPVRQVASGEVCKTSVASVSATVQKVAASAFNQLVAQIVAESAGPETAPTPEAAAKPLPKLAAIPSDQPSELPAPVRAIAIPATDTFILPAAPVVSRRSATSSPSHAQPPSVPVDLNMPIPIAPKLQLPSFAGGGSSEQKPAKAAVVSSAEEPVPMALEPKPILEVKIRLDQQTAAAAPPTIAPNQGPQQQTAEQKSPEPATEPTGHPVSRTVVSIVSNQEVVATVQPPTQPLVHDPAAAPVAALSTPPPAPAPMTARSPATEPQTTSSALREEPPSDPVKTQQPLRSLALEFTPDGAGDIKVRLSERAGDVHISLHGTDPSLAGRVREGVGDLVGSLSKAGYDAEAWTPGEGRQNQRQQPDRRQSAPNTGERDPEEFNGILQQPIQETS